MVLIFYEQLYLSSCFLSFFKCLLHHLLHPILMYSPPVEISLQNVQNFLVEVRCMTTTKLLSVTLRKCISQASQRINVLLVWFITMILTWRTVAFAFSRLQRNLANISSIISGWGILSTCQWHRVWIHSGSRPCLPCQALHIAQCSLAMAIHSGYNNQSGFQNQILDPIRQCPKGCYNVQKESKSVLDSREQWDILGG